MPNRHSQLATRTLVLLLLLAFVAAFHARAAAQSTSQDQQTDGPPSGTSQAPGQQGRRPGPPSPVMELERLTRAMKAASAPLSDTQKVAILGILEDRDTAQQSLQGSTTDRAAMVQQMQALDKASRTAILALLTEAQQKIYVNLRQGPPNGAPPQGGSGAPPPPPSGSSDQADSNIDANTGGGVQQPAR